MRTPTLIGLTPPTSDVYESECFGPVAYLIATAGTDESIDALPSTVLAHGAMTASVYSTSDDVVEQMRDAALDAGVALSENLLGGVFVNQSAAYSDFHGTGANPAANASYTDGAYVASPLPDRPVPPPHLTARLTTSKIRLEVPVRRLTTGKIRLTGRPGCLELGSFR